VPLQGCTLHFTFLYSYVVTTASDLSVVHPWDENRMRSIASLLK